MKKLLLLALLLYGVAYGQGVKLKIDVPGFSQAEFAIPPGYLKIIARYELIAGAFDSGLHVPQYNGVPTDRFGVWTADGAVAVDTSAGYFYWRNGGVWIKAAKFSDIPASVNIYNSDGTITGTRVVTTGGNPLTFYTNATNYLKFDPTSTNRFTHLSTSGTFSSILQNDAGGGLYVVANRSDNPGVGTGGLLYIFNDGTNLELSINNNISGLQNGYYATTARPYSLLATETIPIGVHVDSAQVSIGKGLGSVPPYNVRGIRVTPDWQIWFDSVDAGGSADDSVLVQRADGKVLRRNAAAFGGGSQGLQDVITEDAVLTANNNINIGSNQLNFISTYYPNGGIWYNGGSGRILIGDPAPDQNQTLIDLNDGAMTIGVTAQNGLFINTIAYGSAAANGDLVIKGTSNATKTTSYITLQEDGGLVGIGTTTPTATFHSVGTAKFDLGSDATGDIFYRASGGGFTRKAIGEQGTILQVSNGLPEWKFDTTTLATFTAGARFAADTALFTDSTLYGSFYLDGNDTLIVTKIRAVMNGGTSDTLGLKVSFNDTINVDGTRIKTADIAINSTTTGNETTSFDNPKIPPGNWVWMKTPTVVAGRKPQYVSVSIIGYKKRVN